MTKKPKSKKPVCTSIRKTWKIIPITQVKDSDKKYDRKKHKSIPIDN